MSDRTFQCDRCQALKFEADADHDIMLKFKGHNRRLTREVNQLKREVKRLEGYKEAAKVLQDELESHREIAQFWCDEARRLGYKE